MQHTVYIAFGSNLGHRLHFLQKAFEALKNGIIAQAVPSIILETPAILLPNSPKKWDKPYLNMVVRGQTTLTPEALWQALKNIEQQLGRKRLHPHWSPRTIDLDILLYDDLCIQTKNLTIPHAELGQRDFLLHLLASLNPMLTYPKANETFDILARRKLQETKSNFSHSFVLYPQWVGIVNVTPDSFSDGGCYINPDVAIERCHQLIRDGASVVDIGAQSTRPNAQDVSIDVEWERLHPILDALDLKNIPVSVDTCHPEMIEKLLLHYPIAWINDVSGCLPESTLRLIAQAGCKLCTMHSLSIPSQRGQYVKNLWPTLHAWCDQQIDCLTRFGFALENIILDPGIGFGKSCYQTGILLKSIDQLRRWNCPILIGHSRKSFLNVIGNHAAPDRDIETIAVSQLLKNKIDYLRVHNIACHQRFFATQQWVESCYENTSD